jgi:hypothetical protein
VIDELLTQSKEFTAVAYISSVLGDLEPDMDLEDEAIAEAGIETLREAKGRLIKWSTNFNDVNDYRFLAYLVKTGKFGGKPDLDVNSLIAGTEAIYYIHDWYIAKHHASWRQFTNWLRRNDPDFEVAVAEEDKDKDRIEIKKEGKPRLLLKGSQLTQKKGPGGAGEADTPIKTNKPKTQKTIGAADI